MSAIRTEGLLETVSRRREIFLLFPYFSCVDVLPVRPPRPLRQVAEVFKTLPLVSIRRKIAKERTHHINVRMMLLARRMTRDFLRAWASHVQELRARREILKLMRAKCTFMYLRDGYNMFRLAAHKDRLPKTRSGDDRRVRADLATWFRHFIAYVRRQKKTLVTLPRE
jgi:hypothetical protein